MLFLETWPVSSVGKFHLDPHKRFIHALCEEVLPFGDFELVDITDPAIAKPLFFYLVQAGIDFTEILSRFEIERSNKTFELVRHFECLLKEKKPYQRLMIHLLYYCFDNFSIGLPILWVMAGLNDSEVVPPIAGLN